MTSASLSQPLEASDPVLSSLIQRERQRQKDGIELIASENFTSCAVLECLGSCLTNKYSEGQPRQRYYGGNEVIDEIEELCKKRCLQAFKLDPAHWHVNVQPYSGSPANFAVYTAFLKPHDRIMGLHLFAGGHLTHGFYTPKKRVSASAVYFESLPYDVNKETGLVDFEALRRNALLFRPKLIICGASAYPRHIEYAEFRRVADECGAMLMSDMAHVAGLVAGGQHPSPFPYCDVVTTTTHKTLRGPRSGLIFVNYGRLGASSIGQIDTAVFPSLQGGPHNHQVAAVATQMLQVVSPEWSAYCEQILRNAKALAQGLLEQGQTLVSGGTDNHLIVWDLRSQKVPGARMEKVCESVGISVNKNSVPGDVSAVSPGGVRIGTAAMTSRRCTEPDMATIANILMKCLNVSKEIQEKSGPKMADFIEAMKEYTPQLASIREEVKAFASKLFYPPEPLAQ